MNESTPAPVLELLRGATSRLQRTVDAMTDADREAPSLLPGWSRGHVVAHLVLNAEALAAAAEGVRRGEPVPVYPSDAARDADIEALAPRPAAEHAERLAAATERCAAALAALPGEAADRPVERTPGGARLAAGELPVMRWREVEIHHADLGLGYGPAHWPDAFTAYLLATLVWDRGDRHDLVLRTPDGDLPVGAGTGPVIEGPPALLAWWLAGRGTGEGLFGALPELGAWTRRPLP